MARVCTCMCVYLCVCVYLYVCVLVCMCVLVCADRGGQEGHGKAGNGQTVKPVPRLKCMYYAC
jgi:hypothetical protein